MENTEKGTRDICNMMKRSNRHVIRVPEAIVIEIMTENFRKLMKNIKP